VELPEAEQYRGHLDQRWRPVPGLVDGAGNVGVRTCWRA
jgi:hypothetical protein